MLHCKHVLDRLSFSETKPLVLRYGAGFGIRVKSKDFKEILLIMQPAKNASSYWEQFGKFLDYLSKRAINLHEFGLTFDFKVKPVRLDSLLDGCPRFSSLQICFVSDYSECAINFGDYV